MFSVEFNDNYDMLAVPFAPGPGVILPVGGYNYNDVTLGLNLGQQRRVYGNIAAQLGQFFDGTIRAYSFGTGRVSVPSNTPANWSFQWGSVDIDYRAVVDRNGAISIPRVGVVTVSGIRYHDLSAYLKNAVSRVFRGFELTVSMGQLRMTAPERQIGRTPVGSTNERRPVASTAICVELPARIVNARVWPSAAQVTEGTATWPESDIS